MFTPIGFKRVLNVRGVFYNLKQGLLLIQTEKSAKDDKWTTPGSKIDKKEGDERGLTRVVIDETGIIPLKISHQPFYSREYISPNDREHVKIRAYWIDLPVNFELLQDEGNFENGNRFKFFKTADILSGQVNVTCNTDHIVRSNGFLYRNYYDSLRS